MGGWACESGAGGNFDWIWVANELTAAMVFCLRSRRCLFFNEMVVTVTAPMTTSAATTAQKIRRLQIGGFRT